MDTGFNLLIVWTAQMAVQQTCYCIHERWQRNTDIKSFTDKHKDWLTDTTVWFQRVRAILSFRLSWNCPSDPSNTLAQFPEAISNNPAHSKGSGVVQGIGRIRWNLWSLDLELGFQCSTDQSNASDCEFILAIWNLPMPVAPRTESTYVRRLLSMTWNGTVLSMIDNHSIFIFFGFSRFTGADDHMPGDIWTYVW